MSFRPKRYVPDMFWVSFASGMQYRTRNKKWHSSLGTFKLHNLQIRFRVQFVDSDHFHILGEVFQFSVEPQDFVVTVSGVILLLFEKIEIVHIYRCS